MSYILDIVAIICSIVSLIITLREKYQNGRPFFKVESVKFVPDNFVCYSTLEEDGYKMLSEENKRIIKNSQHKVLMQNINGKHYLLFNMLRENAELKNVKLILAPLTCTYINTGAFVNDIKFTKATTILQSGSGKPREYRITGGYTPSRDGKIELNIAYVCRDEQKDEQKDGQKDGQNTSLKYKELMKVKEEFDYLTNKEMANRIINFKREEFEGICYNAREKKYKVKVIFELDEFNGLIWRLK